MKPRFEFETKLLAALAAAVLVVTLLAAIVWKISQDSIDAVLQMSRAHETIDSIAHARGNTLLIEVSTRAFVISGDAANLAEHAAALSALETSLRRIKALTDDDARQQARWMRLREATDARIATARRSVQLRATESFEAARNYNSGAEIPETRERVLQVLREMEEAEDQMLAARTATQLRARQIMAAAGVLAALAVIVLLLVTYVLIRRQYRARGRAEAALRTSEEDLATTLDSIGDAVLVTDTEGRVTRMNPVAERLTGWPLTEAQGRPVDEVFRIVNEQTRASAVVPVAKVLETGELQGLANHTVLIARDGTEWPIADSAAPIRDAEGRVGGVVLVFRDVTVERRAEQAIREQNDLLDRLVREGTVQLRLQAAALDAAANAIIITDRDVTITWVNRAFTTLTGYSAEEVVGRNPRLLNAGVQDAEYYRRMHQAISAGKVWRGEIINRYKDGRLVPEDMTIAPVHGDDGNVTHFIAIKQDISERKRAEQEIRDLNASLERRVAERTAQLQATSTELQAEMAERKNAEAHVRLQAAALDAAANCIIITDRDSTILWTNRAFTSLTGYSSEEAIGQNPRLLKSGVHDAQFYRGMYQTILAGSVWQGEMVNRYKDGRLGTELMSITSLHGEDGEITHFIADNQDITARKRAEEKLRSQSEEIVRKNAELEQANLAKSDFLTNMSHELRTPLNSIIGFSEMLKDGVLGALEAKQRGFVTDIFDAGTHLLSLINDILDLSKVEAGALELEAGAVDVAALLKASTLVVREKAHANRIRLDTRLDPALGSMLADERKVKQILYNLLANAIKFTPESGAVTLSARRCTRAEVAFDEAMPSRLIALPPGENGEFLAIAVQDSGVGIAEADLQKLFEPFTQVDSSISRRHAGAGLGLALVRRLAELHGGTVGVASRPGAGSRFCVWLPWRETPAAQEGRMAPEVTAPSGSALPLALVIEDDDSMADLIAAQLRIEGFSVMRAATAEEGLVRAAKRPPQLITLDIFLPVMDGWEFLRQMKTDPKLADTPVVIISVSDHIEAGIALGARRVLHKPFTHEELVATLAGLAGARDGERARVLVVDDNVEAVELLATELEAEGYRVVRAYGGAEAVAVAHSERPDFIVLDLMMPQMSGFEVAQALRDSEQTARIPILVLTAKDLSAEERARLNDTVGTVIAKTGFSTSDLLVEVRRALPKRAGD